MKWYIERQMEECHDEVEERKEEGHGPEGNERYESYIERVWGG